MRLCNWSVVISISRFGLLNSDPESWLEDIVALLLRKIPGSVGALACLHWSVSARRKLAGKDGRRSQVVAGSGNIIESQIIFYELQISAHRKTSALCFCRHQSTENGSAP